MGHSIYLSTALQRAASRPVKVLNRLARHNLSAKMLSFVMAGS